MEGLVASTWQHLLHLGKDLDFQEGNAFEKRHGDGGVTCAEEARSSEESKKQSVGASEVPPWGFQDGRMEEASLFGILSKV